MTLNVTKRDGTLVPLDISKLRRVIAAACADYPECDILELEMDVQLNFREGITTEDIQSIVIQTAVEKISVDVPNWQFVAAKLYTYDVYQRICRNREIKEPYTGFYDFINKSTAARLYHQSILEIYTREEIDLLESYIKPERDELFNYVGIKTLTSRYTIRRGSGEMLEFPQECWMGIAMFLASKEKDRLKWAKDFYDVMSKLELLPATPTLSNARKPFSQLSSCFIASVDDSLDSIFDFVDTFAHLSKYGGGVGCDLSTIRAQGSEIRGFKNVAGGTVPWIRILNDTAVAVDQLGTRKGSLSITLNVYHADIMDFLNLKTNNGDDRRKAHDVFPSVGIPDNFMRAVRDKEHYHVFDPYLVKKFLGKEISDYYGDEFEEIYNEAVCDSRIETTRYDAREIMKAILKSAFETGLPFMFFRDTANRANPNKHCGSVKSSNLCMEIIQNMAPAKNYKSYVEKVEDGTTPKLITTRDPGDLVVCNLSSINLQRVSTDQDLSRIVPVQVRMLDNVIDLNFYPVPDAEYTNKKYRAIGIGTMGYHALLAQRGIVWESEEHLDFADKLYEKIAYIAIEASRKLAVERGAYSKFKGSDWENGNFFGRGDEIGGELDWTTLKRLVAEDGLRNGHLVAIAPTGSISLIAGTTAGIDPIFSKIERTEKKNGVFIAAVPNLNDATFWLYKESHKLDQHWVIKAGARRQKWIDQSQSLNMFVTSDTKAKELFSYYMKAWELGCKTTYYLRSKAIEIEECESCT